MYAGRSIFVSGVIAALAASLFIGCTPQSKSTSASSTSPVAELPRPPRNYIDVPPPQLLLSARLEPLKGDALQHADKTLAQILTELPTPPYLTAAPAPSTDASRSDQTAYQPDDQPPGEVLKLYTEARDAFHHNEYARALELINNAIQIDPTFAPPHELLGRIYLEINQNDRALQQMRRTLERDPDRPVALFVLGRVAYEQNRWADAVVDLARAINSPQQSMDPGLLYTLNYYLGQSLLHLGYDAAAMQQLIEFHREPQRFSRSTRMIRQVMVLSRQRDAVAVQIADVLMRLNRVDEALQWYDDASGSDQVSQPALLNRRIYARLRAAQDDQAHGIVVQHITQQPDAAAMDLLRYVADNTRDRAGFTRRLTQAYERSQAQQPLALAVIAAMPQDDLAQFDAFARRDLAAHPDHTQVFTLWLNRVSAQDPAQAVTLCIDLIQRGPHQAGEISAVLLNELKLDPPTWLATLDALPDDLRDSAVGFYLRGIIALRQQDSDSADAAFQSALDRDFGFMPARIATIELELARGNAANALQLIGHVDAASPPRLRYLYAAGMQATGQTDTALSEIDRLLTDYPRNVEYLLTKARLQRMQADFTGAENTLTRLLTVDPAHEPAYVELFAIYETNQPNAAKFGQLLTRAQAIIPASRIARLMTARLYIAQSKLTESESLLKPLAAEYPNDIDVLGAYVSTLGRKGQWDRAMTLLEDLLAQLPDNIAALQLLRQVAIRTDAMDRFYPHYETYLKAQPDSATVRLQLAQLYQQSKRYDQAIASAQSALQMGFDNPAAVHAQLSQLYQQSNRPLEAISAIDQAISLSPDRAVLYGVKAWLLHEQQRTDAAIDTLTLALGLPLDDGDQVRLELARLYVAADRFDDAITLIDRMIAADPANAANLYYYQAALLYGKPNAEKLVETVLLKALQINPNHLGANNDLGYSWADHGRNLAQAEQMIRKAVQGDPESYSYLDSLGWVKYKQGDFPEAIRWLERAMAAPAGDDPTVMDHLADAYWRNNQRDKAAQLWRNIVDQLLADDQDLDDNQRTILQAARTKVQALDRGTEPPTADVPEKSIDDAETLLPQSTTPQPTTPAMQ